MNNEIKEMLELHIKHQIDLLPKNQKTVLDYITNLQQLNLSLAKENEQEKQFIKDCGFENGQQLVLDYIGIRQEKEDYKSRIEKAVEYIKNNNLYDEILDYDYEENPYVSYTTDEYVKDNLLNILNGKE